MHFKQYLKILLGMKRSSGNFIADCSHYWYYIVTQTKRLLIMNQTITIRIPEDMQKELKAICESENKSVSELVRDSLKRYIAIHRFRQLRNTVLPFTEAQGIATDKDVFREIFGLS